MRRSMVVPNSGDEGFTMADEMENLDLQKRLLLTDAAPQLA